MRGRTSILAFSHRDEASESLVVRAEQTLSLIHRWGYAPTVPSLARQLVGGPTSAEMLESAVRSSDHLRIVDGFVCLKGREDTIVNSKSRVAEHGRMSHEALSIASAFTRDLMRLCPFVEAVCLSGSVASGGYSRGDDIDFDLFVDSGTKYSSYLIATLIGMKYSWRYRNREVRAEHRTPFLPKITCINVVWPSDQTRPFVRQDLGLAFELLRCQPLAGSTRFEAVLADNPWLVSYFPQLYGTRPADSIHADPGPIAVLLGRLQAHPRFFHLAEAWSRRVSWIMYRLVQLSRERDPGVRERMAFLKRVKYPYEVFQD